MGLGPHPVERARSGGPEGAQRPLKKRPHRLEATKSGHHMSGVGAPAIRPRPLAAGRCTAPKKRPRPRPRLYVWGWGPSCTAPPCSAGA
eukprot:gene20987-biopygen5629